MKNSLYLLLAAFILLAACSKEERRNSKVNVVKVNEVLQSKVPYSQRTALFEMLNADEKVFLWKEHLSQFLPASVFTEGQISILKEVISAITPEIFQESTKAGFTGKMAVLEYKAKAAFPIRTYFQVFEMYSSTPEDIKEDENIGSVVAPPVAGDCYCRSSSWCGTFTGSDLAICLWNDEGSNCNTTNGGCGLLGFSDCRGVCCVGAGCLIKN